MNNAENVWANKFEWNNYRINFKNLNKIIYNLNKLLTFNCNSFLDIKQSLDNKIRNK